MSSSSLKQTLKTNDGPQVWRRRIGTLGQLFLKEREKERERERNNTIHNGHVVGSAGAHTPLGPILVYLKQNIISVIILIFVLLNELTNQPTNNQQIV